MIKAIIINTTKKIKATEPITIAAIEPFDILFKLVELINNPSLIALAIVKLAKPV